MRGFAVDEPQAAHGPLLFLLVTSTRAVPQLAPISHDRQDNVTAVLRSLTEAAKEARRNFSTRISV